MSDFDPDDEFKEILTYLVVAGTVIWIIWRYL